MNAVFALIAAGFIQGVPGIQLATVDIFESEKACLVEKVKFDKEPWDKSVQAGGSSCVKIEIVNGKPI